MASTALDNKQKPTNQPSKTKKKKTKQPTTKPQKATQTAQTANFCVSQDKNACFFNSNRTRGSKLKYTLASLI